LGVVHLEAIITEYKLKKIEHGSFGALII